MVSKTVAINITGNPASAIRALEAVGIKAETVAAASGEHFDRATSKIGGAFGKLDGLLAGFGIPFSGVLSSLGSKFDEMSTKGASFGAKMAEVGKGAALGLGAGAALIGVASLKMAGDFESGITTLVTGAGEAERNIGLVSDGILKMAVATATSTKQLTDGMFMIESAGFHGAAGLLVLKAAAEGAKVGNADLGVTANAVTTVMKDYHLGAGQAADATNFLVSVVSQGKTHMEDLATAISGVLPIASSLHVPLADVGGALATLTSHGIEASQAATFMRFSMNAMIAPSGTAVKALKEVGLSATDLGETLTTKGLVAALTQLEDHLQKKFPQGGAEATAALSHMLGGVRGMGAALGLSGQNLADFTAATAKTGATIEGAHGKILGFNLVQHEFNFKLGQAKEVVQTLGIRLGLFLIPIVEKLAAAISNVITWFEKHQTVALALAFVIAVPLMAALVSWIGGLAVATVAVVAATWPILVIIAACAALAVGVIYLWDHWNEIWTWVQNHPAYAAIIGVLGSIITGGIMPIVIGVIELGKNWDAVWATVTSVAAAAGGAVSGALSPILSMLNSIIGTAHAVASAISSIPSPSDAGGGALDFLDPAHLVHHASGGVFSSPHLGLVAESGPEAIIPLSNPTRGAQVMAAAGLLGGGGDGGTLTLHLVIDYPGGEHVIDEIVQYQRRHGTHWQSVS